MLVDIEMRTLLGSLPLLSSCREIKIFGKRDGRLHRDSQLKEPPILGAEAMVKRWFYTTPPWHPQSRFSFWNAHDWPICPQAWLAASFGSKNGR